MIEWKNCVTSVQVSVLLPLLNRVTEFESHCAVKYAAGTFVAIVAAEYVAIPQTICGRRPRPCAKVVEPEDANDTVLVSIKVPSNVTGPTSYTVSEAHTSRRTIHGTLSSSWPSSAQCGFSASSPSERNVQSVPH